MNPGVDRITIARTAEPVPYWLECRSSERAVALIKIEFMGYQLRRQVDLRPASRCTGKFELPEISLPKSIGGAISLNRELPAYASTATGRPESLSENRLFNI
ncbi:MAG TPA: hypothetical protein VFI55_16115 [Mycobacterium sp.]|nr:hypothetical protein [Mycobacterium sp.]